jgi:GMP synthase (glutamine-hydrolysing)
MLEARDTGADEGLSGTTRPCAASRIETKKPVLIVLHQRHSSPGHVGQWFQRNGHALDIRRHCYDDPLPKTLEHHCGAVIFGGPQSANDTDDFIKREIEWIGVALKEEKPFLGICLGAQMLAHHLGAKVDHCQGANVEIGYHRIRCTDPAKALGALPEHVYQWHREGFEIPSGGKRLAASEGPFPNQAMRYGPAAIGLQFHPEITYAQVNRWSGANPTRLLMRGARERADHMSGHLVYGPIVHRWLDQFLTRWVKAALAPA